MTALMLCAVGFGMSVGVVLGIVCGEFFFQFILWISTKFFDWTAHDGAVEATAREEGR